MITLTDAIALTGPDGITGRNNARDIRKGLLASIIVPDVKADPLAVRNGVFAHDWDTKGVKSLRVDAMSPTASRDVMVYAGAYICERKGQGPYLGWGETSAGEKLTMPEADQSDPRWDIVFAHVRDQAAIGTDSGTDPIVDFLQGSPSSSPQLPSGLPDGAVELSHIYRPSIATRGDSSIVDSDITDVRKSTCLIGGTRHLLPGDKLSDPGKVDGERRYRTASSPFPSLEDYWDAKQQLWRGTQGFTFTADFPGAVGSANKRYGSLSAARTRIITLTVPDPGFPYRLGAYAYFHHDNGASVNYFIAVNNGPFASQILTVNSARDVNMQPNSDIIFTGNSTVQLTGDLLSGGPGAWSTDARNVMTVRVDPA